VDCTIIVGEVRSDEESKRKGFREKKRNWVKEEEEEEEEEGFISWRLQSFKLF
jgi:hypothetical protein